MKPAWDSERAKVDQAHTEARSAAAALELAQVELDAGANLVAPVNNRGGSQRRAAANRANAADVLAGRDQAVQATAAENRAAKKRDVDEAANILKVVVTHVMFHFTHVMIHVS